MKETIMQFPNVKGSDLYDGVGHFIEPLDVVRVEKTNIYVLEYNDKNKNKRARALVQKTSRGLAHIPLMNKTGLNSLFEQNIKGRVSLAMFMDGITNIHVTKPYPDLESFLVVLLDAQKSRVNDNAAMIYAIRDGKESVMSNIQRDRRYYHENDAGYYANKISQSINSPDYVAPKEEATEVDRGDLGFWSNSPAAIGPGRQSGFGRPMMYVNGMRPGMPGPNGGPPPMGPIDGPIPPREGPIDSGPTPEGPIDEAPQGPKL